MDIKEMKLVMKIGECMSDFYEFADNRPGDCAEFVHHIHILQRHVMCREARRNHPELFGFTEEWKR